MKGTITQLAAFAGKSERTIRRYLAKGKWPHTILQGGLIEIDDSLLEPERGPEDALLTTLKRIESKLDSLAADVLHLAIRVGDLAARGGTVAATHETADQGTIPEGLIPWRDYAKSKGYSETTIARAIQRGQVPIITGHWKRGHSVITGAIDEAGKRAIDRLYGD